MIDGHGLEGLTNIDQEWNHTKNWNFNGIMLAGCNLTNLNCLELRTVEL